MNKRFVDFNGKGNEYMELIDGVNPEDYIKDSQVQVLKNNDSLFGDISDQDKTELLKKIILMIKEYNDTLAIDIYQKELHEEKNYKPIVEAYTRNCLDQEDHNKWSKYAEEKVKTQKTKDSDIVRKKRNRTLNAAKKLKAELKSFEEMCAHLNESRIDLLKKDRMHESSYYKFVELLEIFIQEVEEQTYEKGFEILKSIFINSPTIIGKKWLEKKLSTIFETFEIKTTNAQIASLASQLSNA